MSRAVYVSTTEPNSGKSIVSLGLMQLLLQKVAKVGYFRPIIDDFKPGKIDNHIDTMCNYFKIDLKFEDAYAYTRSEIISLKNDGKENEIISTIIKKYKAVEEKFDFVLVEGTSFSGETNLIEFDINVLIAKNLGIPAIILASGIGKTVEDLVGNLNIAYDEFKDKGVEVLSIIANKVEAQNRELILSNLAQQMPEGLIFNAIPINPFLANPSIKEIVEELNADILFGADYLNNQAAYFNVGAMQLRNYLNHLKEGSVVITPGDRADIILGALQANNSANYPAISGIVLTGGLIPEKTIIKLIEGLSNIVPILSVHEGTFAITNRIGAIKSKMYAKNIEKIKASIKDFSNFARVDILAERLINFEGHGITPRMFQYKLLKRAQSEKKHIVLPEGMDDRILFATKQLIDIDAAEITLLGDRKEIENKIRDLDISLDLSKVNIINPSTSPNFEDYANTLFELRKHKNINLAMARDLIKDVSYFGTMMVYKGDADGMVSGAIHTTLHTIRPALQFIKTKPGVSVVSSVFFMCLEDRVSVYGDCAINPNPTAEQLSEIAISSAATSAAFGIRPKVAMLSYSSGESGKGEDVERVRKATKIIKDKCPDLQVVGPIQYDAAVDINVRKTKMPGSIDVGQASVFIFPDLNTGNNTYKAVQRETKALAIGPIIQGLNKPVNDLSRGCTIEDVFNTVVVTAIQAQEL